MSATSAATRKAGFLQGITLLLPITMAVVGVSIFTATAALMTANFANIPHGEYLSGFIQTMPGFWIVAFSPVAGWLADRYGRRPILILSMFVYAVAGTAPFFLDNIYTILITRCFVGMCESIVMTVTTTMLCDYFKGGARDRWLAAQTGVASLSALVIINLGGVLGAKYGWHGPFLVYLYSLILVAGVIAFTWEPAREVAQTSGVPDPSVTYHTMPWGRMCGIIAITLLGSVCFYSTITKNAEALNVLGVTNPDRIGNLSSLASLGVPIGTVLFWVLGRLPIGWLLGLDFLLIGSGFMWMGGTSDPTSYAVAANVQQIGCGLVLPTLLVWASRGLAYNIRGRGVGLWQGAFGIGLFISAAVLTFLGHEVNGLLAAFGVLGRVALAAAIVAVVAQLIWGRKALPSSTPAPGGVH